jgi:hypothetical protein
MTTNAPCNCGCQSSKGGSKANVNERPRYYARQLVTPDDLTLEQDYFRAKLRRHNRFLHGWGVVCGATVVNSKQAWKVIVKSGYILGPYGDEIYIDTDQCVDIRVPCTPPAPASDNGCEEAQPAPPTNATQYIAVQYQEVQTQLIRVPLGGCGCDNNICEYTRFRDGYQICVLDHCPNPGDAPPIEFGVGPAPDCLPCAAEPWVALASFTVDANGNVTINQCDCRRQVVGCGSLWWSCNTNPNGGRVITDPEKKPVEHEAPPVTHPA